MHYFHTFRSQKWSQNPRKSSKKILKNCFGMLLWPLGALGPLLDRFLIDFYQFWSPFGDPLGMFCGLLGGLYGASGASWGLLGALLELLEELQLSLTCTQRPVPQLFPTFPPCPAPQRTPARSTASRPAAYPSALHRVAPRSVPLRAPPCPAPQRSSERFQKRFLHTSFDRARSSSSICAFRFPREVRFTGAGGLMLLSYSLFLHLFLHSFFWSLFCLIFINFWIDFGTKNWPKTDQKWCYFFDYFWALFCTVFSLIFHGPPLEKSLKSAVLSSKIRVSPFFCQSCL